MSSGGCSTLSTTGDNFGIFLDVSEEILLTTALSQHRKPVLYCYLIPRTSAFTLIVNGSLRKVIIMLGLVNRNRWSRK